MNPSPSPFTPCLFSVSYAGFWGQTGLTLADFIAHAANLGFPSIMVAGKRPHLSPLDCTPEMLATCRAALARVGVRCDIVAAYTDFSAPRAAEVPAIEMQIAYVENLCRVGSQLGASIVRIFTAYDVEGHDPHAAWRRVVDAVREICDRAASYGVRVAIQNHHDLALPTRALLDLLGDIDRPNCKLGFDAWSPALRGESLPEVARLAAPHAVITTNADYVRIPRYRYRPELVNYERQPTDWVRAVEFGTGFIDYEGFFRGLSEGGFRGWAVYEMCSPLAGGGALRNLDAKAGAYLRWMRDRKFVAPGGAGATSLAPTLAMRTDGPPAGPP
jgi:sugar phosphate isomerase/epimerase